MPIVPLHSVSQDNWNEVLHDIFVHVMPLQLTQAAHDANDVINSTIAFVRSRGSQWDAAWPFLVMLCYWHQHWHHLMLMALSMLPLFLLGQDNHEQVSMTFSQVMVLPLVSLSHYANSLIYDIILFVKMIKTRCSMVFSSCHTIVTGSMRYQLHCQWHHCICKIKTTEMKWNMTFCSCDAIWCY